MIQNELDAIGMVIRLVYIYTQLINPDYSSLDV